MLNTAHTADDEITIDSDINALAEMPEQYKLHISANSVKIDSEPPLTAST